MEIEVLANLGPGVFHPLTVKGKRGYYLLPLRSIPSNSKLFVLEFTGIIHLNTSFKFWLLHREDRAVPLEEASGVLIQSNLPVFNYSTSLLSYSKAWQKSTSDISITPDATKLVFKSDLMYVYEVSTIATLVTTPDLSDALHSYLTMI